MRRTKTRTQSIPKNNNRKNNDKKHQGLTMIIFLDNGVDKNSKTISNKSNDKHNEHKGKNNDWIERKTRLKWCLKKDVRICACNANFGKNEKEREWSCNKISQLVPMSNKNTENGSTSIQMALQITNVIVHKDNRVTWRNKYGHMQWNRFDRIRMFNLSILNLFLKSGVRWFFWYLERTEYYINFHCKATAPWERRIVLSRSKSNEERGRLLIG